MGAKYVVLFWLVFVSALVAAPPGEWTDVNGNSVKAELEEVAANELVLRKADGTKITIPFESLSRQSLIKALGTVASRDQEPAKSVQRPKGEPQQFIDAVDYVKRVSGITSRTTSLQRAELIPIAIEKINKEAHDKCYTMRGVVTDTNVRNQEYSMTLYESGLFSTRILVFKVTEEQARSYNRGDSVLLVGRLRAYPKQQTDFRNPEVYHSIPPRMFVYLTDFTLQKVEK